MFADVRPALLPLKVYSVGLATLMVLGAIGGGVANFVYARNNPGADPYMPKPAPVVAPTTAPIVPSRVLSPEPMQRAKVPEIEAPGPSPAVPLVSSTEPRQGGPVLATPGSLVGMTSGAASGPMSTSVGTVPAQRLRAHSVGGSPNADSDWRARPGPAATGTVQRDEPLIRR